MIDALQRERSRSDQLHASQAAVVNKVAALASVLLALAGFSGTVNIVVTLISRAPREARGWSSVLSVGVDLVPRAAAAANAPAMMHLTSR